MPHTIDKPAIGPGITCGNDGRPTPGQQQAPAARTIQGNNQMDGTAQVITLDTTRATAVVAPQTFEATMAAYEAAMRHYDVASEAMSAAERAFAAVRSQRATVPVPDILKVKTAPLTIHRRAGDVFVDGFESTLETEDAIRAQFEGTAVDLEPYLTALAQWKVDQAATLDGFEELAAAEQAADEAESAADDAVDKAYRAVIEFPTTDPHHIAQKRALLVSCAEDDLEWVLDNLMGGDEAAAQARATLAPCPVAPFYAELVTIMPALDDPSAEKAGYVRTWEIEKAVAKLTPTSRQGAILQAAMSLSRLDLVWGAVPDRAQGAKEADEDRALAEGMISSALRFLLAGDEPDEVVTYFAGFALKADAE